MKMGSSNDRDAVKAQYASSKSLDIRLNFHNMYSTNKMGFGPWLVSNYEIKEGMKVLELGTGTGSMWTGHDDLADYLQSLKALHGIGTMERDEILKMLKLHEEDGAINLQKEYGTFVACGAK
ncbi:transcriptional regulator [Butyrivibrio fibrisolvens]|uniref:transcriptional regulator n=1 Tax=Butyrivibrio fibrisolvens TaxID=831 RepID=UPI0003B300ED|nr:transcriptional regulator [Butyrivibrio fibrisolvens]